MHGESKSANKFKSDEKKSRDTYIQVGISHKVRENFIPNSD